MKTKLVFTSDSCELASIRRTSREFLTDCGFDECQTELLVLAIDEACTNIIRHAYDGECKPIRIEFQRLRDRIRVILRDYGKSCDPKNIHGRSLKKIRPGGVGVHIIRQAFDSVTYEPRPRGTKLTLEKKTPTVNP